MNLRARTAHLGAVQWLALLFILAVGVALLFAADTSGGAVRGALREAGVVTVGTVFVTSLYDVAIRPAHDAHLLGVVRDSLVGRARDYGLSGIERIDFAELFRRLDADDELWWLDTYCPDLDSPDVQDALRSCIEKGASVRMLVINPESDTAEARAQEIETRGYTPEDFQKDARHNLTIVNDIKAEMTTEDARRLRICTYSGLPCAPMYLRVRDGRALEGWTSYFLTIPTYEAAHLYWGQPSSASRKLPTGQGLGLQAFRTYFEKKWTAAEAEGTGEPQAGFERIVDDTRVTLGRLRKRNYAFVLALVGADLERTVVEPAKKVLSDGKLRRDQTAETRDLLLELAEGEEILLVHSTSENALFDDVSFWRPFNDELAKRVKVGQLSGVRRLFVLVAADDVQNDPALMRQIGFHVETEKFDYRLLSQDTYRAIQEDIRVTAYPVHDFGIYGSVAYVWPRPGYATRAEGTRGYFQVDPPTVEKYRKLYLRCWSEGRQSEELRNG